VPGQVNFCAEFRRVIVLPVVSPYRVVGEEAKNPLDESAPLGLTDADGLTEGETEALGDTDGDTEALGLIEGLTEADGLIDGETEADGEIEAPAPLLYVVKYDVLLESILQASGVSTDRAIVSPLAAAPAYTSI